MKKITYVTALVILLGSAFSANAQSTKSPAVSAVNGSLSVSGGQRDDSDAGAISGVISAPINNDFGFQLDTAYNRYDDVDAGGFGGHLFYRDPESYLIGLNSVWYTAEAYDTYINAIEAELYLSDFTVAPTVGLQSGDATNATVGYVSLDVNYYVDDNLKFTAGGSGYPGSRGAFAELEWLPNPADPYSFFANIGDANNGAGGYVMAGAKYSFNTDGQTLKYRDRYSDPKNSVASVNNVLGQSIINDSTPVAPTVIQNNCGISGVSRRTDVIVAC